MKGVGKVGIKAKQMNNQSFENSVPSFGFGGKTVIRPLPNSRSSSNTRILTPQEVKEKILNKKESSVPIKDKKENK